MQISPQLLTSIPLEDLKGWSEEQWSQWIIESKIDGARAIYYKGEFYSRTGKKFYNLGHLTKGLVGCEQYVFDGELVGGSWADTMSMIRSSKTKKEAGHVRFVVFDAMRIEEWDQMECLMSLETRGLLAEGMLSGIPGVETMGCDMVQNFDQFETLHALNLENGCDGTVLKRRRSLYEFKRSKDWLKVKPVETIDAKVEGIEEGKGKYQGMSGHLVCSYKDTIFGCSGMTDKQRKDWWNKKSLIINKTIEVKVRGFHPSGMPIEPRFVRIREDL